ncbi:MAG TPA: DUF3999 family protein, partial [Pseudoxanthomonas sp.]|nr:DUF3999 family protein [Pseudoxanthomonas sp.]
MKKWLIVLCLLPAIAAAQAPAPYAKRWPLVLSAEQAGAYRVVLDRDVYTTTAWPDLRDVDVLDAHGKPVAAALFGPEQPTALPARRIVVPWFPLPAQQSDAAAPSRVSAQFGENGRIVRIEADGGGTAASGPARAFLVDLSGIRDSAEALEFTWDTGTPRESRYRIDGSPDLQNWEVVQDRVTLVDLQRG